MTIEIQIKTLLKQVCSQVHLKVAPAKTPAPYICYTPVSTFYDDCLAGQTYGDNCFQIDVYSKKYSETKELQKQAYTKLKELGISQVSTHSGYESDTNLHRETLEFFII